MAIELTNNMSFDDKKCDHQLNLLNKLINDNLFDIAIKLADSIQLRFDRENGFVRIIEALCKFGSIDQAYELLSKFNNKHYYELSMKNICI